MKKLLLLVAFLGAVSTYQSANAQVSISANINIGRPVWVPVGAAYVENYYFPDIDIYYDMGMRQYRYMDRGRWICAPALPAYYRNVDLVRARRVVIHEHNPYLRHDYWRARYRVHNRDYGRPHAHYRNDHGNNYRNDGHWDRGDRGPNKNDRNRYDNGRNDRNDRGNGNGRHSEHRGNNGRGHK